MVDGRWGRDKEALSNSMELVNGGGLGSELGGEYPRQIQGLNKLTLCQTISFAKNSLQNKRAA